MKNAERTPAGLRHSHAAEEHVAAPASTTAFVDNRSDAAVRRQPVEAIGQSPRNIAQREQMAAIQHSARAAAQRQATSGVAQLSFMSRLRWGAYVAGLPNNQVTCDAIDTGEVRTTLQVTQNALGDITHRIVRMHSYTNDAWGEIGSVTMDRSAAAGVHGPLMPGAAALPGPGYDDAELTLHTAAAGGAGNAGVATHLFPAVLGWIDRTLRGVQRLNMNPAGGAASKSVIADLGGRLGNPGDHANANAARVARKNAEAAARLAAAAGGPAVVPIGSGAGAAALNTWDTRLNAEHVNDLMSLDAAPLAGLTVSADNMSQAGPAQPADIAAMQAHRDNFVNALAAVPAHPVINAAHPGAAHFQAAAALTNVNIAANPRAAARTLRMALLSSRSGAAGIGGGLDAGYQITLSGPALAHAMPGATRP